MVADKDLKNALWTLYTDNPTAYSNPCFCCRTKQITVLDCVIGHVVAKADGGPKNVENTRPICADCNNTMGKKNLLDYRREKFGSYICYSQNCKQEAICGWFCDSHVGKMRENDKSMFDNLDKAQKSRKLWNNSDTGYSHTSDHGSSSSSSLSVKPMNKDKRTKDRLSRAGILSAEPATEDNKDNTVSGHLKLLENIDAAREDKTCSLWYELFVRADYGKKGNPLNFVKSRIEYFCHAASRAKKEKAPIKKLVGNLKEAYVFYPDLRACGTVEKLLNVFRHVGIFNLPLGKKYEMFQQSEQLFKQNIVTHADKGGSLNINICSNDVIECFYNNCFDPYATAIDGNDFTNKYIFSEDGSEYRGYEKVSRFQVVSDDLNEAVTRYNQKTEIVEVEKSHVTSDDFPNEVHIGIDYNHMCGYIIQYDSLQQICNLLKGRDWLTTSARGAIEFLIRLGYKHRYSNNYTEIIFTRPADILNRIKTGSCLVHVVIETNISNEKLFNTMMVNSELDLLADKETNERQDTANVCRTMDETNITLPEDKIFTGSDVSDTTSKGKDVSKDTVDNLTDSLKGVKIVNDVASSKDTYKEMIIRIWVSEESNGLDKSTQCLAALRDISFHTMKQLQPREICQSLITIFGGDQAPELEYILFSRLGGRMSAPKTETEVIMTRVNNLITRNPDELLHHILDWVKDHHKKITYDEMLAFINLVC